jgi:hypothetical protein
MAETAPDPAVLRYERRLHRLEAMAEEGMVKLRALELSDAKRGETRSGVMAFSHIARCIRMTLLLDLKTEQELRDLKAGVVRVAAEPRLAAAARCPAENETEEAERPETESFRERERERLEYCERPERLEESLELDAAIARGGEPAFTGAMARLACDLGMPPEAGEDDDEEWAAPRQAPRRPSWSLLNTTSAIALAGAAPPFRRAGALAQPIPHALE